MTKVQERSHDKACEREETMKTYMIRLAGILEDIFDKLNSNRTIESS
jgi:hypothetical protein